MVGIGISLKFLYNLMSICIVRIGVFHLRVFLNNVFHILCLTVSRFQIILNPVQESFATPFLLLLLLQVLNLAGIINSKLLGR